MEEQPEANPGASQRKASRGLLLAALVAALAVVPVGVLGIQQHNDRQEAANDPASALLNCIPEAHRRIENAPADNFSLRSYEECIAGVLGSVAREHGMGATYAPLREAETVSIERGESTFVRICHSAGHRTLIDSVPEPSELTLVFEALSPGPCHAALTHVLTDRIILDHNSHQDLLELIASCDRVPWESRGECPEAIGHVLFESLGVREGSLYCENHEHEVARHDCVLGVLMQAWRAPTGDLEDINTPWEEYRDLCLDWPLDYKEALTSCGIGLSYALVDHIPTNAYSGGTGMLIPYLDELTEAADLCNQIGPQEASEGCRNGFMQYITYLDRAAADMLCQDGVGPCNVLELKP